MCISFNRPDNRESLFFRHFALQERQKNSSMSIFFNLEVYNARITSMDIKYMSNYFFRRKMAPADINNVKSSISIETANSQHCVVPTSIFFHASKVNRSVQANCGH